MSNTLSCMLGLVFLCAPAWALTLVSQGSSDYTIVIPDDAIQAERTAARELVHHIKQISGAELPIASESQFDGSAGILLGANRHQKELGIEPDWQQLGKEGYLLRVVARNLIIAGGRPRGTLYGVYALLEDQLGCRWFAPDTTFIPKRDTIELPALDLTGGPAFEYRDPWMYAGHIYSIWWRTHFDPKYVARTRNSGNLIDRHVHPIDNRYGGGFTIPRFGHNLSQLVPAKDYAASHPEYFALHDGKRIIGGDLELCLSHPDVARIAADTLRRWMREAPDADMFFIGQSDTSNYCQCERCVLAYRKYSANPGGDPWGGLGWGGLAGRNLHFANEIAQRLEEEFPNRRIGVFAYGATRNPPLNIQAHRNIVVWYCPIERCACHPIDRGPINGVFYDFAGGIDRWKAIAEEVYLYDYRLGNALAPPADLLTLAETVRAAKRLGVGGVMVDAMIDIQAGFGFCRYWLWARLLRDPDVDAVWALREFLDAYYGSAAPHIDAFIRLTSNPRMYGPLPLDDANIWTAQDSLSRQHLVHGCHLGRRKLTRDALETGYALMEKARQATADDPQARAHVDAARMVLQYAMLKGLPADDPRLKAEKESLLHLAESLEMPSIQGVPLSRVK